MKSNISLVLSTILAGSAFLVGCGSDSTSAASAASSAGGGKNAPFLMLTDANATATNGSATYTQSDAMNSVLSNGALTFPVSLTSDYNVTIPGSMVVDVDFSGDYNSSVDKFVSDFGFSQLTGVGGGKINVLTTTALSLLSKATTQAEIDAANNLLTVAKEYDVTETVTNSDLNSTDTAVSVKAKTKMMLKNYLENIIAVVGDTKSQSSLGSIAIPTNMKAVLAQAKDNNYTSALTATITAATAEANNTTTIASSVPNLNTATIQAALKAKIDNLVILQKLQESGAMTATELKKAAILLTDTDNNVTAIISKVNTEINTSSVSAEITAADTAAAAAAADAAAKAAAKGVLAKLKDGTLKFGTETVSINPSYTSFAKTLSVTNATTVSDFFNITIPVNRTVIDKDYTESNATLAVKIMQTDDTSKWTALMINGAELVFNTDTNTSLRSLTTNFNSNTRVTVASSLAGMITEMGATSVTANLTGNMSTNDLSFSLSTLLNNLNSNSTKVNSAITKLNTYLVQTNAYTVQIGVDGNVTTDFGDQNITIGSTNYQLKGLQGNVSVNNPNYNKAPSALSCTSTYSLSEGEAMTAVDLSACFSDTEALTYSYTTLPTGLMLSSTTGSLTGTPTTPTSSTDVNVTVTDSANQTASKVITLVVGDNPSPTLLTNVANISLVADTNATGDLSAYISDDDNSTLTFAITGCTLPSTMSFNTSTGVLTATAPTTDNNVTGCTLTATDKINQALVIGSYSNEFNISVATDPLANLTLLTDSSAFTAKGIGGLLADGNTTAVNVYVSSDFSDTTIGLSYLDNHVHYNIANETTAKNTTTTLGTGEVKLQFETNSANVGKKIVVTVNGKIIEYTVE